MKKASVLLLTLFVAFDAFAATILSLEVEPNERKFEVNWEVTGPAQPIDLGGTGTVDMDMN